MADTNNSEPATNRTNIVATVHTASRRPEALRKLIEAVVDVFRLNFSHGRREEHSSVLAHIRAVSREMAVVAQEVT